MEPLREILEQYSLLFVTVAGGLLLLLLLRLRRLRARVSVESAPRVDWEDRARAAEARASKAEELLKREITPHLAEGMKEELVQTLVSHRRELLQTQHDAAQQTEDLERRLAAIQAELESRQAQLETTAGIRPALPEPSSESTLQESGDKPATEPLEPPRRNPFTKSTARRVPEERLSFTDIVARRAKMKGGPEGPPESSSSNGSEKVG
ncbi:MAG: hypothetical protein RI897_1105 [Verrucomicrobiota bacterium]|jgi:hypothetical protein